MCGIYGFNFEDKGLADRMDNALRHRGPDGNGLYTDNGITLGHRRLSIIDLSEKGKQPMTNEDGTIIITFNGEIYNFIELRKILEKKGHKFFSHSDTEVIVHAYEEWELGLLQKLNGMFAFCIYDKGKNKLFLARDHMGIKPLYYYFDGKSFIFASEIKAILEDKSIKKEINKDALNQYISLRYNPLEQTMLEGIKRVLPGEYLTFDLKAGKLQKKAFFKLEIKEERKSEEYFIKKLDFLLFDSVKRQMISDVPLGVFLSGGIDSTLVTSHMRKANPAGKIKSFSVGFEDGENVDERTYAKTASEIIGTEHKEYVIPMDILKILPEVVYSTDEPMADPALLPLNYLSKKASEEVKVVLTGDGGDELFLGYEQYRHLENAKKISKIPAAHFASEKAVQMLPLKLFNLFYKHASEMDKEALLRIPLTIKDSKTNEAKAYYDLMGIFSDKERRELLKAKHFKEISYSKIKKAYFKSGKSLMQNLSYFDIKRMLPESFLMKTDRMTMAHSLEARVPLLDYRIAQLSQKMPANMKTSKEPLKKLLLKDFPKDFVYRKKQTFHVPLNRWLAKDKSLINGYEITKNRYFKKEYAEKIMEKAKKGNLYSTKQFFNMVIFDIWEKVVMR